MTKKTRRAKARRALLTLSLVLVTMMVAVGGTIAWLTDTSENVKNTFSPSNIEIEMKEHDYVLSSDSLNKSTEVIIESDYKMVPGDVLPKDPFVRVKANSENCYVFVKIEKSTNFDTFMTYTEGTNWHLVSGTTNVYYYGTASELTKVTTSTQDQLLEDILLDDQVKVKTGVTETEMATLYNADGTVNTAACPTLTFTAYAVQAENLDKTAIADIWTLAQQ